MPTYYDTSTSGDIRAWAKQQSDSALQSAQIAQMQGNTQLAQQMFAWQKKLDEAAQTGKWEGQWNNPQEQWYTGQFGQWYGAGGEPAVGTPTLAAQQQGFQQGLDTSTLYGQYYAPGTTPTAGQQTLSGRTADMANAATVAGLTGWYNAPGAAAGGAGTQTLAGNEQQFTQGLRTQEEQRAAQAQQQSQAQQYLSLLSNLRGPVDWAKYQQVLGSTPGGMRDLIGAAMGEYTPGGGATTGYQPQAASLQSLMGDVTGNPYSGQGGGQLNMPNVYNQNSQGMYAQQPAYNPQAAQQQYYSQYAGQYAPQQGGNQQTWGSGIGVGQQQATPQQQQQGLGGGTNLPAPNQISAQSWNNMAPSQQQMLMGMYENQGWDKGDVQALYNQSLPKYGSTNQTSGGTWNLR